MSYCRFSSLNFMSDVYVYEDCYGGWTTHVAGNRYLFPPIPEFPIMWLPRIGRYDHALHRMVYPSRLHAVANKIFVRLYSLSHRLHMRSCGWMPRVRINLPFAGERFNDGTPQDCARRLRQLSNLGYTVLRYAIDRLQHEAPTTEDHP